MYCHSALATFSLKPQVHFVLDLLQFVVFFVVFFVLPIEVFEPTAEQ